MSQQVGFANHHFAMQAGIAMPSTQHERLNRLVHHSKFESWLLSPRSESLVVMQQEDTSQKMRQTASPLAYLQALLSLLLVEIPTCVPLLHFSKKCTQPGDKFGGLSGVLRTIISAVLLQFGDVLDLSFVHRSSLKAIGSGDIQSLCELLQGLLAACNHLDKHCTLFCLVDGLSVFEDDPELMLVIQILHRLALNFDGVQGPFVFKVLLTFPTSKSCVRQWFPEDVVISWEQTEPL